MITINNLGSKLTETQKNTLKLKAFLIHMNEVAPNSKYSKELEIICNSKYDLNTKIRNAENVYQKYLQEIKILVQTLEEIRIRCAIRIRSLKELYKKPLFDPRMGFYRNLDRQSPFARRYCSTNIPIPIDTSRVYRCFINCQEKRLLRRNSWDYRNIKHVFIHQQKNPKVSLITINF